MTPPFFQAQDFWKDDKLRLTEARYAATVANAKLAGKIVVDKGEWEELMRMKKHVDERTLFVRESFKDEIGRLRDNETELESLRALKAEVDAAPETQCDGHPDGRHDGMLGPAPQYRAKLVGIEEIEK